MAPPLGTPELQAELASIARRIVENGKGKRLTLYYNADIKALF